MREDWNDHATEAEQKAFPFSLAQNSSCGKRLASQVEGEKTAESILPITCANSKMVKKMVSVVVVQLQNYQPNMVTDTISDQSGKDGAGFSGGLFLEGPSNPRNYLTQLEAAWKCNALLAIATI